jgi:hypothetical protein
MEAVDRDTKKLLFILVIIILGLLLLGSHAQAAEIEKAEFFGIVFKTRYQTVKINTPILVETELIWDSGYTYDENDAAKLLKFTLKNPESSRFKFLMKITPRDFEKWQNFATNNAENIFLINNQRAYFVSGKETVKIDEITINTEQFEWLSKYKAVIEKNLKNCQMAPDKKGDPDMVCPPLLIEAQIVRIERSILSPFLPTTHIFPHPDYLDIYIEILSIRK